MRNNTVIQGLFLFGVGLMSLKGQSPITDRVTVNFANEVRVGSQTIPAGEYTVKQLGTASNPRLLEFTTEKGMAIQATATAIAALDNNNRNESSVILETHGGQQHLYRIWIQGKSYGYEFPIDRKSEPVREASRRGARLTANYTPGTEPVAVAAAAAPAEPAPVESPAPAERPAAEARVAETRVAEAPVAAAAPEPAAPQQRVTEPAAPAAAPLPNDGPPMPKTSLHWPLLAALGLGLVISGFAMRILRGIA